MGAKQLCAQVVFLTSLGLSFPSCKTRQTTVVFMWQNQREDHRGQTYKVFRTVAQ